MAWVDQMILTAILHYISGDSILQLIDICDL